MCFLSNSSYIIGLLSRPSNESKSLNLPWIVSQSSNPYVITEANLLSSSLIFDLNS